MSSKRILRRWSQSFIMAVLLAIVGTFVPGISSSPSSALSGPDVGVGILGATDAFGYTEISAKGGTYSYGSAVFAGSLANMALNAPIVDGYRTPNNGLVLVGADGGTYALNGAPFPGSLANMHLNAPIVAAIASHSGAGALLIGADGGTFQVGDYAPWPGSLANMHLNAPIVDAAAAPNGGIWMAAADGGVITLRSTFYGAATNEANTPPPVGGVLDGSNGGVATVSCANGSHITVAGVIAAKVQNLLDAARASGISLCGSGWRSNTRQIELRRQHCGPTHYDIWDKPSRQCSPPTARPGASMHEKGEAIDFTVGGKSIGSSSSAFKWLSANAARYGMYNLPSESWHWSTNGK